jgi:hypothetical protein
MMFTPPITVPYFDDAIPLKAGIFKGGKTRCKYNTKRKEKCPYCGVTPDKHGNCNNRNCKSNAA